MSIPTRQTGVPCGTGRSRGGRWWAVAGRLGDMVLFALCATAGLVVRTLEGFRHPRPDPSRVRRVLLVRLDLLGDVVFSLASVQALKEAMPQAAVTMLVLPMAAPVAAASPAVDEVLTLDVNQYRRPSGWRRWREIVDTVWALRARQFDVCLCLHGRIASAFTLLSGAPARVGYAGESYPFTMNIPVPGHRYIRPRHEVDMCLDLVRAVGVPARRHYPVIDLPVGAAALADRLLSQHGVDPGGPFVVAHPGAANGSAKRWPEEMWAAMADRVQREMSLPVVITGGPGEVGLARAIASRMSIRPAVLAGKTNLLELMGILRRAAVVLSGDTGPLHLAEALGTPVVALFGPTDPAHYGPFLPSSIVLRRDVPCGPCYDMRSPADCKRPDRRPLCMWGITVDEVIRALGSVLHARAVDHGR